MPTGRRRQTGTTRQDPAPVKRRLLSDQVWHSVQRLARLPPCGLDLSLRNPVAPSRTDAPFPVTDVSDFAPTRVSAPLPSSALETRFRVSSPSAPDISIPRRGWFGVPVDDAHATWKSGAASSEVSAKVEVVTGTSLDGKAPETEHEAHVCLVTLPSWSPRSWRLDSMRPRGTVPVAMPVTGRSGSGPTEVPESGRCAAMPCERLHDGCCPSTTTAWLPAKDALQPPAVNPVYASDRLGAASQRPGSRACNARDSGRSGD